jgi:non-specific serine/threonine protein kinase
LEKTRDQVFAQVADQGLGKSQNSIFSALLRLRQICCHPQLLGEEMSQGVNESGKFEALQDMVEEIISEGHRILLFSQFVEMLKIMRKWLERRGIPYEYLTGETKNREEVVNRFNRDDNIPIFLISLKAGGTGLNLTGADYVIHYDPWWNPAAEDQATDRAHRIGQTKSVFVYRLIAKGTVEEKIMKLKDRKRGLVDSIISADRSIGKSLSFEDLKEILTPDF